MGCAAQLGKATPCSTFSPEWVNGPAAVGCFPICNLRMLSVLRVISKKLSMPGVKLEPNKRAVCTKAYSITHCMFDEYQVVLRT